MFTSSAKQPTLSIVIVALNEGTNLRRTVTDIENSAPARSEIIVVDDGSSDCSADFLTKERHIRVIRSNRVGVASARNLGGHAATGEVILFADGHIRVPHDWWSKMLGVLKRPRVGAVGPGICDMRNPARRGYGMGFGGPEMKTVWLHKRSDRPYQVPVLPGACLGIPRNVFHAVGGFDEGNLRLGGNDQEISLRLWLLGYQLWLVPSVVVAHAFRSRAPYPIEGEAFVHNRMRVAFCHFGQARIARVLAALRQYRSFPDALALALLGDWKARRAHLIASRVLDDDWFFRKFEPTW